MFATAPVTDRPALETRPLFLGVAFCALLAIALAAPSLGYVVVLKDGQQLTVEKAPEVDGDKVILLLQNGTQAFYRASEVDFAKTEEINAGANLSNAKVIDGFRAGGDERPVPIEEEASLSDLVATRSLSLPSRSRRPERTEDEPEIAVPYTRAGFVDLQTMERKAYPATETGKDIQRYLKSQGHESVRVYQGSAPDRPFVELTAASEASVFKGLKDVANALVQMRDRHADTVAAFDVLMMTDDRVRAGQFSLTPELANLLVTGEVEPPEFFVQYVEF